MAVGKSARQARPAMGVRDVFDPTAAKGFCPMRAGKVVSGVEIHEAALDALPGHPLIDGPHRIIAFRWGGDMLECACACAAAAALAEACGAACTRSFRTTHADRSVGSPRHGRQGDGGGAGAEWPSPQRGEGRARHHQDARDGLAVRRGPTGRLSLHRGSVPARHPRGSHILARRLPAQGNADPVVHDREHHIPQPFNRTSALVFWRPGPDREWFPS